jgi:folate-dependent phosphoribosylglycinamide formyltransferase PurN
LTAPGRVVLLAGPGDSTNIVYNYLAQRFADVVTVVEDPVPRMEIARRRAKRLGWATAAGQVIFVGVAMPFLQWKGRRRAAQILEESGFDVTPIAELKRVGSVNSEESIGLLRDLDPAVIVVNGTRIISRSVLSAVDCTIINTHAGITPRYRGVHGGYWALRDRRRDLVGTTVHLVDPGIDTGGVLAQGTFQPGPQDSIATYPYLHLACGLPLLADCVKQVVDGEMPTQVGSLDDSGDSILRWHPTFLDYLHGRIVDHVR